MKKLATLLTLIAGFSSSAQAQTAADWLHLLSPDRILRVVIQSAVVGLRTQMGISYRGLAVHAPGGRATVTDLEIWPAVEWEDGHLCQVRIDRLNLTTTPWTALDTWRLKIEASGLDLAPQCLPPEARQQMRSFGLNGLSVPLVTADITYTIGSGRTEMLASAFIGGFAVATLDADFAYIAFREGEPGGDAQPVLLLSSARLALQDRGAWETARALLPPPLTAPETGGVTLGAILQGALAEYELGYDPAAAEAAVAGLIASAAETWPLFLADPDTLVLETGIPAGESVFLDFPAYEASPVPLIEVLRPTLALATSRTNAAVPTGLLRAALGTEADQLAPENRHRVGLALLTGTGAPRNVARGSELLSDFAAAGDAGLAFALAEALAGTDPTQAYRWALAAAAARVPGGAALLDRLESAIGPGAALRLQTENDTGNAAQIDDPAEMRRLARAYVDGRGVERSYARALYWGLLAAAAGDPAARSLLDDLEARLATAPTATLVLWRDLEDRARDAATATWIEGDLPARLSRGE